MSLLIVGFRFSKIVVPKRSSFWTKGSPTVSRMALPEREALVEIKLGYVGGKTRMLG